MSLGYGLAAIFPLFHIKFLDWKIGFIIQAALMTIIVTFMFLLVPSAQYSHKNEGHQENEERLLSENVYYSP
jgi:hypothetical protein